MRPPSGAVDCSVRSRSSIASSRSWSLRSTSIPDRPQHGSRSAPEVALREQRRARGRATEVVLASFVGHDRQSSGARPQPGWLSGMQAFLMVSQRSPAWQPPRMA